MVCFILVITESNIVNGCKKCYMNPNVADDEAEVYRGKDLDAINWKQENIKI